MLNILLTLVAFLVMISVLVAAHELGHYLFARLFKMGVEEFAIGFGRPVLWTYGKRTYTIPLLPGQSVSAPHESTGVNLEHGSFDPKLAELDPGTKLAVALEGGSEMPQFPSEVVETPEGTMLRETTAFTFRAWPLGGFVRIKGMLPHEDGSEIKVAGGFYSKPAWQRFVVLLAGPVFSVLAGMILIVGLLTLYGDTVPTGRPVVQRLESGKPAEKAGILIGDRIVSVGDKAVEEPSDAILAIRAEPGKQIDLVVRRGTEDVALRMATVLSKDPLPELGPDGKATGKLKRLPMLGINFETRQVLVPFGEAAVRATMAPIAMTLGLVGLFQKPKEIKDSVGGPIAIVAATSNAVDRGIPGVVELGALLSISLGIFNLLPIPPLDGGQMIVAVAEMLRGGRRLSFKIQNAVAAVGALLVLSLFVAVIALDVGKFFINK